MIQLPKSSDRIRTSLLLAVSIALGAVAIAVGIDDNPLGILLGLCSAMAFVVAFVHTWRTPRPFLRLIVASFAAAVVYAIVSNLTEAASARGSVPTAADRMLNVVAVTVMLLIPAALLAGVTGALVTWRFGSRSRDPQA
jgi:hypothetical protein